MNIVKGDDISIIDGNALFQSILSPPATVAELAYHIFQTRLPKMNIIHFVIFFGRSGYVAALGTLLSKDILATVG